MIDLLLYKVYWRAVETVIMNLMTTISRRCTECHTRCNSIFRSELCSETTPQTVHTVLLDLQKLSTFSSANDGSTEYVS